MVTMMMRQGGTRLAGSMMATLGPRLFSHSAAGRGVASGGNSSLAGFLRGSIPANDAGMNWIVGVRRCSTAAQQHVQNDIGSHASSAAPAADSTKEENKIVSYWGVPPVKVISKDGTVWKWKSFRVRTYAFVSVLFFSL